MVTADLHIHTTFSDGSDTPQVVVEKASALGLRTIAITDHDAIGGVEEAKRTALKLGLEVIPGVELSSYVEEGSFHILGLFIDWQDSWLNDKLEFFKQQRELRGKKIVEKLQQLGVKISMGDVLSVSGNGSVGRPHIAEALVKVGAVASFEQAFEIYIGKNRPAYVQKYKISPAQAGEIIHKAGGIAILAHPLISAGNEEQISQIMEMGMDGIEVYHPKHEEEKIENLKRMAERNGWLITGGSDYHGEGRTLPSLGECGVDNARVEKIRNFWNNLRKNAIKTDKREEGLDFLEK